MSDETSASLADVLPASEILLSAAEESVRSSTWHKTERSPKRWSVKPLEPDADGLARAASIPLEIAALLYIRGIRTPAEAEAFLSPRLDTLHDPYAMRGMEVAVVRIQRAIAEKETILIYGDYDVDGTLAVVLLKTAIEMLGGACRFHVPHRLREGYGMQAAQLSQAALDGVHLVISVDNGVRAFEAAEEAQRLRLDLIITDHHLPDATLGMPPALAVLNPNQPGCDYPCKHLCGAGVAFKLAQALLEASDGERAREKILPSFLKLLAIATIADAVPLVGENRVFAALGLAALSKPVHPGLRALIDLAEIAPPPHRINAHDIGFRLAPRLNAAGRMDIATDVVDLFTTRNAVRCRELAEKLHRLNAERRNTEQTALAEIERLLLDASHAQARFLVLDGEGWHRGVIGILASRVVDRTGKPALVLTHQDGEAYGSGRSVASFHLLAAISTCSDLFTRFGGHAHAVGFSLPSARVAELRARLQIYAAQQSEINADANDLLCEMELALDQLTPALQEWLHRLAPYGMGNPDPVFLAHRVRVCAAPRIMKERHIRLQVSQGLLRTSYPAVGWNLAGKLQGEGILENSLVDIVYKLREAESTYSRGMELEIVDLRAATLE